MEKIDDKRLSGLQKTGAALLCAAAVAIGPTIIVVGGISGEDYDRADVTHVGNERNVGSMATSAACTEAEVSVASGDC